MVERGLCFCDLLQNVGGGLTQGFAMSREANGASQAFKQGIANLLLQGANLLGERGLADAKLLSGDIRQRGVAAFLMLAFS